MEEASQKTVEVLEELIEERLAAIKRNQGAIETFKAENERFEGEIRGLELAKKLFKERQPEHEFMPDMFGKYVVMGLTDAIVDVIQTNGASPGLTGAELVAHLKTGGFKANAKDPYTSAYGVAMGLVKQGRILEGKKVDGTRTFMRKP
jgi:hypothetical protein